MILSASADPANLFLAVDTVDDSDSVMHKEMMGELLSEVQNRSKPTSLKLALFTGEEESFAFFRAVSRLNEMTSHQWLQDKHTAKSVDGQMRNEVYTGNQVPDIMMQESKGDNDTLGSLDFADEASYSGYVEMYDRYAMQDVKEKPIERKSENMFNRVESMLKVKEVRQPRFQDAHFWGFKKWGSNAGNWGQGLGKFFNSNDKK